MALGSQGPQVEALSGRLRFWREESQLDVWFTSQFPPQGKEAGANQEATDSDRRLVRVEGGSPPRPANRLTEECLKTRPLS